MSDTGSPSPTSEGHGESGPFSRDAPPVNEPAPSGPSRLKRCCLFGALFALLSSCLIGGYALHVVSASRSPAALEFSPFRYRPLERSLLTAKFEFLELPSRLLTGGDAPVELVLNERELNALLFGEAGHSEATEKARVLIQPEDRLLIEYSKPGEAGAEPFYLNLTALVSVTLGPGVANVELHEAKVGSYEFGALTRGWLEDRLQDAFERRYQRDSRLRRIRALSVESGRVRITYQPEKD